jgi:hypothetical protein
MEIRAGVQVTWKKKLRGESLNLVKTGNVISVRGQKAIVQFPADHTRAEIPISELQPVSARYPGRAVVNINPFRR